MFGLSFSPVVCRREHALFTLLVFAWVCSGIRHTLCCVFALFFFVLCTLCCQILWIVDSWLPLRYSLTFFFIVTIVEISPLLWNVICYGCLTIQHRYTVAVSIIDGGKPEYLERTNDLLKLYQEHLAMGIEICALCTQWCQFLLIVNCWLLLRFHWRLSCLSIVDCSLGFTDVYLACQLLIAP
jgi:hypothetical protein